MIYKYNNFTEDLILESVINETVIYYDFQLRRMLRRMRLSEIGADLINIEGRNAPGVDLTFLALDKEGYLSFITPDNANNLIRNSLKGMHDTNPNHPVFHLDTVPDMELVNQVYNINNSAGLFTKSRNQIKIGRLINKLFPGKYTDKQIEEFVNEVKALIENQGEKFEIVEGEQIKFWYDINNYADRTGNLGKSCMATRGAECEGIFNFYTRNPEVCKMLILKESDKLIGRALIWKLNTIKYTYEDRDGNKSPEMEYFLDRQYTLKDSDMIKLKNYADQQKWGYKTNNNYTDYKTVTFNGKHLALDMTVQLKPVGGQAFDSFEYMRYPFLDTFRRYDPKTGILYNDSEVHFNYSGQYLLGETRGGRGRIG